MDYTKLLIYFIIGFIINFFLKKSIEGFSFDILSADSYPNLLYNYSSTEKDNLETTYNINSKKILIKILELNISSFDEEKNQDLKNEYFKANISPEMVNDNHVTVKNAEYRVIADTYKFTGAFILSDIEFLSPKLFKYNNDEFLSSIRIPGSKFEDYELRDNYLYSSDQWWTQIFVDKAINIGNEYRLWSEDDEDRIRNHVSQKIITSVFDVENPQHDGRGYIYNFKSPKNIYRYIDYDDPNDNFTIQIIEYLDEDSNIIKNNKEKIKKYIYSQFLQ